MVAVADPLVYRARGGAAKLFRCRDSEVLLEGPAGTGKTRALLEYCQYLADNFPGTRILFIRKTRASMTESVLQIFESKVLLPGSVLNAAAARGQRQAYHYPNGSEIVCGGLDNVDRIMSAEYDVIALFEGTEATENDWEKLLTRLRNNVLPWQQGIVDCNPSFPAHWLNTRATRGQMTRILSRHHDNPSLTDAYLARLSRLTGHRRARLFLGQWAAAEGLIYDRWDEAVFVRERPGTKWERAVIAIDEGYANPCAVGFWLIDGDGYPHLADEWYRSGELEANVVRQAIRYSEFARRKFVLSVEAVIVDPSAAKLIAALGAAGLPVVRADNDVLPGIASVQERLTVDERGRPRLTISPRASGLLQEIPSYIWQTNRDGTKRDAPVKVNDHSCDQMRYMSRYLDSTSGGLDAFTV